MREAPRGATVKVNSFIESIKQGRRVKVGPAWLLTHRGESTSRAIAAASIIATVVHGQLMKLLHIKHPGWEFDQNRGYGNAGHLRLIQEKGLCPEHRRSFAPVKRFLQKEARSAQLDISL